MTLTLPPEIKAAITEQAHQHGETPEQLVLKVCITYFPLKNSRRTKN